MPRLTRMTTATSNLRNVENNRHLTLRSASLRNLKPSISIKDGVISSGLTENQDPFALQSKKTKRDSKEESQNAQQLPASKKRTGLVELGNASKAKSATKILHARSNNEIVVSNSVNASAKIQVKKESSLKPTNAAPHVPDGVVDFDALNAADPYQESNYAMHIFEYYKQRESLFTVPDYLQALAVNGSTPNNRSKKRQPEITESMRAILVDWLVEVQESFEMNHETLYTAVRLVDLYLARRPNAIAKANLQLVGVTAFLLAAKVDERIPPLVDDFVYVCDDAYTREDVLATEIDMFNVVGFDVGYPLSYRFLRRYARVCQLSTLNLTFGRYILETSLMEYSFNVNTSESRLAAAVLILVLEINSNSCTAIHGNGSHRQCSSVCKPWESTLRYYSGYSIEDCLDLVVKVHAMLLRPASQTRKTIRSKYSHPVFHSVAKISIPDKLNCINNILTSKKGGD